MCHNCVDIAPADLSTHTILLVVSGGGTRKTMLTNLRATGVRIVCYHREVSWAKDLVDDWIVGPLYDEDIAWANVSRYLEAHPSVRFDGILCYDEFGVALAAYLAERLGVPNPSFAVVSSIRNKHKFRETCVAHGVAAPKFLHVPHLVDESVERAFTERGMSFPVVVKPALGAGSNYVKKVRSMGELRQLAEWFEQDVERCRDVWGLKHGENGGMLVEEYIDGEEVDIDCVVEKGQVRFACVSDNHACAEPFFLEMGGRCPSVLPYDHQVELLQLLEQVVAMYGAQLTGCFHFEAKYSTARGAVPIEFNLRIGNAETYTNILTAFGVNLIYEAARGSLGYPMMPGHVYSRVMPPRTHLASVNFTPDWQGVGRLEAIQVDPFVTDNPAFVGIHFYHQPGAIIALPPDGFQSCGWMVAKGNSPEEAEQNLVKLMEGVRFQLSTP